VTKSLKTRAITHSLTLTVREELPLEVGIAVGSASTPLNLASFLICEIGVTIHLGSTVKTEYNNIDPIFFYKFERAAWLSGIIILCISK